METSGISSAFVTKCSASESGTSIRMRVVSTFAPRATEPKPLSPGIATWSGAAA